jgi:hypothetical protein
MSYIIYKICCDDLPEYIYVGSTANFRCRKNKHKISCNNGDNKKLYTTIRENGGWDNWRMVIIEECGEISLVQVRIKEEECRIKLKANLNSIRCHRTEEEKKEYNKEYNKEYRETNEEYLKEQKKQYIQANKEKIKEKQKQYYEANKEANIEKIREYREANKEKKKEYNKQYGEVNKEKISEQKKQYHQANKEKINEQKKQTFTCECGRTITLGDKARHLKSNVHTNFINNKII